MKIEIIETGSSGNCFIFDDEIMIDCGVSYSRLSKVDFKKLKWILLTHEHKDHFKERTIAKIASTYKHVRFVCGEWMQEWLTVAIPTYRDRIDVIDMEAAYIFGQWTIAGVNLYHDVPNCGYRLVKNRHRHLHATDTTTMEGIYAKGYHTATIECNHCINEANRLIEESAIRGEFTHLNRAIRTHMSVQDTLQWCELNEIGELIPVHIGALTKDKVLEKIKRRKK